MTLIRYFDTYFLTCTVLNWQHAFKNQKNINEIIESLNYLTKSKRIIVYAFVIMSNHLHLIYQVIAPETDASFRQSFLGFTSRRILSNLSVAEKRNYYVNTSIKEYQFWKERPLSVELFSPKFFNQKFNYIHDNPRRADLVEHNEDYFYCSYRSYLNSKSEFEFLTLW